MPRTLALPNFAASGFIGTANATVDRWRSFEIAQSTTGRTLALPEPTGEFPAEYSVYVANAGTASFFMHYAWIVPGSCEVFRRIGTTWYCPSRSVAGQRGTFAAPVGSTAMTAMDRKIYAAGLSTITLYNAALLAGEIVEVKNCSASFALTVAGQIETSTSVSVGAKVNARFSSDGERWTRT